MLSKFLSVFFIIFCINILFCLPIYAQIPDIFTPYMQGREDAISANRRDAYYYQQAAIADAINMFLQTGNFDYLCIAKYYGSYEAARVLRDYNIRCVSVR